MKKYIITTIIATSLMLTACSADGGVSSDTTSPAPSSEAVAETSSTPPETRPAGASGMSKPEGASRPEGAEGDMAERKQVTGQVTEVFGNSITVEIGNLDRDAMSAQMPDASASTEGGATSRPTNGEMPEDISRPEGEGGGTRPSGGGMMEGNAMMGEGTDYSEIVELTGETVDYTIPVGTPVTQFGTEMTFSQITEEMYVTITFNGEDTITAVNVLG